jgi:hypothetical protein
VQPDATIGIVIRCANQLPTALDMPFLLLPFRPGADSVGSKSFIRNFFKVQYENTWHENKHVIEQELRLLDPMVRRFANQLRAISGQTYTDEMN